MRPTRLILVLSLLLSACHKHVPVAVLPPPVPPAAPATAPPAPAPAPVPAPAPAPPPAPAPSRLAAADRAFKAGSYDEAARAYDDYLRGNSAGAQRDHALFYSGLSNALRPAPATDWTRAAAAFKEVVDEHPDSPYKQPAALILSLHSELDQAMADNKQHDLKIKQLTTELDRLKRIDADRRKKP